MVGDPGTGGGDDDVSATCGNGTVDENETCDDGNTAGGDGCSATCTEEAVPRLDMVVDKPTINTELNTTTMLTVTFVASGGFSGAVGVTATVVDASNNPVPGWTVTLNNASVNVPDGGSADAIATLTIPSENRGLAATVKIDATSSLGAKSVSSTVTALNQISLAVTDTGQGNCAYPMGIAQVTVGTLVRLVNKLADPVIFHSDGANRGLPHQDVGGTPTPTNGAYERTITSAGPAFGWYCHSPGPNPNQAGQPPAVGILAVAAQ
jgi:cysteine-rich repeat protein